jgi:DNA replication and repair protein RecF
VARYEQVIVTAAVEADIPPALAGRVTRIRAGSVVDETAGAGDRAGSSA